MFCSKCGNQVSDNQKFCNKCGNLIGHDSVEKKYVFCNKCGNQVDSNQKFCNKCGNSLNFDNKQDKMDSSIQNDNISEKESKNENIVISDINSLYNSGNEKDSDLNSNFEDKTISDISNSLNQSNNINNNLTNNNNYQSNNNFGVKQQNNNNYASGNNGSNKKMILVGAGIGFAFLIIISIISSVFNFGKKYYFDTDGENHEDIVTPTSNQNNNNNNSGNNTSNTKKSYRTVIVADNVYEKVSIKNKNDALALIVSDSVNQKDNCPKEIKQIEDEIIKKYDITAVNLCEMDIEFAKEISNVFKKVYDEYPEARGSITNLTLTNTSMTQSYIAAFMPTFLFATSDTDTTHPWVLKTTVLLNSSYFLNEKFLEYSVSSSSESGHFPKNATKYSPVAHELGHYLSFLAMIKNYNVDSVLFIDEKEYNKFYYKITTDFSKGTFSLKMITNAYNKYKKDTGSNIGLDEWRGTISQYALAKDNRGEYIYDETIAESFHDVYLNGDNAAVASKYVIAELKKELRG